MAEPEKKQMREKRNKEFERRRKRVYTEVEIPLHTKRMGEINGQRNSEIRSLLLKHLFNMLTMMVMRYRLVFV